MNSKLLEIISPEHIEEVGRDAWQECHDNGALYSVSGRVIYLLLGELCGKLYPNGERWMSVGEFVDMYGRSLVDFLDRVVDDCLDVDALTREAQENTDEMREIENARKGRY